MVRDPRHIDGDIAEAIATKELLAQGYYVFRSVQGTSPIDLVAISPGGEILMLDVKKVGKRKLSREKYGDHMSRARTPEQKRIGVWFCYVDLEKETIEIREPQRQGKNKGKSRGAEG